MESLEDYEPAHEFIVWVKACLSINKENFEMTDGEIRKVIRWVGECSYDTIFVDGEKPILRRVGIGMMLTVTLLEFPWYYMKYELAQFN